MYTVQLIKEIQYGSRKTSRRKAQGPKASEEIKERRRKEWRGEEEV